MISVRMMQKQIKLIWFLSALCKKNYLNSYDFCQSYAKHNKTSCDFCQNCQKTHWNSYDFCYNYANNNVNSYDFCQNDAKTW